MGVGSDFPTWRGSAVLRRQEAPAPDGPLSALCAWGLGFSSHKTSTWGTLRAS